jgi:hypothetical protein
MSLRGRFAVLPDDTGTVRQRGEQSPVYWLLSDDEINSVARRLLRFARNDMDGEL